MLLPMPGFAWKMFSFLESEKVLPEKIIWKMPEPQPVQDVQHAGIKKRNGEQEN